VESLGLATSGLGHQAASSDASKRAHDGSDARQPRIRTSLRRCLPDYPGPAWSTSELRDGTLDALFRSDHGVDKIVRERGASASTPDAQEVPEFTITEGRVAVNFGLAALKQRHRTLSSSDLRERPRDLGRSRWCRRSSASQFAG